MMVSRAEMGSAGEEAGVRKRRGDDAFRLGQVGLKNL